MYSTRILKSVTCECELSAPLMTRMGISEQIMISESPLLIQYEDMLLQEDLFFFLSE